MSLEPLTPERRRAMTREHLLEAAAVVFARNGFHGSSLDEVASAAGFTKGAVYSNFTSKEDLFVALLDDRIDRQFVAFSAGLEAMSDITIDQMPEVRDLIDQLVWDDQWTALYLEFVLYAARNPDAREKLVESSQRAQESVARIIEQQYSRRNETPPFPITSLAMISELLFTGLGIEHLVNPAGVSDDRLESVLEFLYITMGVGESPVRPPD
ncbi:MAG: TetR/AcrR family transcriptional regulator [Acidimicrobiia bacterium]